MFFFLNLVAFVYVMLVTICSLVLFQVVDRH